MQTKVFCISTNTTSLCASHLLSEDFVSVCLKRSKSHTTSCRLVPEKKPAILFPKQCSKTCIFLWIFICFILKL